MVFSPVGEMVVGFLHLNNFPAEKQPQIYIAPAAKLPGQMKHLGLHG